MFAFAVSVRAGEWTSLDSPLMAASAVEEAAKPAAGEAAKAEAKPEEQTISETVLEGGDACGENCMECCDPCCCCICPPGRIWARGELLVWWADGMNVPPLVTAGNVNQDNPAALGVAGTSVLYGGDAIDMGTLVGGRFELGGWFDECQKCGIQVGGFFLGEGSDSFVAASDGSTVLGRPIIDATTGEPIAQIVSFQDVLAGSVGVNSTMNTGGANLSFRKNLCCTDCPTCESCDPCDDCGWRRWFDVPPVRCCRIDAIGGITYFGLRDNLGIGENLTVLPGNQGGVAAGTNILIFDEFKTRNNFCGGQIGAVADLYRGRWWFELSGQVALGANFREVEINGGTRVTDPAGGVTTNAGGLLTQTSNIGSYDDTVFCAIPQFDLRVGYQLTRHVRVYTGYTFLYASNVVRAGDQIDPVVNPNLLPPQEPPIVGPLRPAFAFQDTDFWLQGVMFGAEVRF